MPTNTYLPYIDSELYFWGVNALSQIEAAPTPATFGLTDTQAAAFADAYNAYAAAYLAIQEQATRTPGRVTLKDEKKKDFQEAARQTVAIIQAYPGTTDQQRRDLKISIRDNGPSPIPAPEEMPQLLITNQLNNRVEFRLFNAAGGKARPENTTGAYIYCWVGEDVPAALIDWKFRGKATRSKNNMIFPTDLPAGTTVRLTAMWVNAKGEPGPACSPVMFRLPGAVDGNSLRQAA